MKTFNGEMYDDASFWSIEGRFAADDELIICAVVEGESRAVVFRGKRSSLNSQWHLVAGTRSLTLAADLSTGVWYEPGHAPIDVELVLTDSDEPEIEDRSEEP